MAETKISKILKLKQMSQRDLQRAIQAEFGYKIGDDRISMICTGRLRNYHTNTAVIIAQTLGVKVDDILEY